MLASLSSVFALVVAMLTALARPAAAQSGPPGSGGCVRPWAMAMAQGPAPAAEPWQAQRLGLGVRFGSISFSEDDHAETGMRGVSQEFLLGGLFARYRLTRRLELELSLDQGTQQDESGGSRELSAATGSLLIHMRPHARWDWYILFGVGGDDRRRRGAPDSQADTRGHFVHGAGVERRFDHLVVGFDARMTWLTPAAAGDVPISQEVVRDNPDQDEATGGVQLTFTGGWYF